jgi:hypothetical protein
MSYSTAICLCSCLLGLVFGAGARAQEQEQVARIVPATSIRLALEVNDSEVLWPELAQEVSEELGGITVVPDGIDADGELRVVVNGTSAHVTYRSRTSAPIERTIELPTQKDGAIETIALLAGNLARREADELLAELASAGPAASNVTLVGPPRAPVPPPTPPASATEAAPAEPALDRVPLAVSFVPGLSTDFGAMLRRTHTFSFGAIGNLAGGLDGLGFAGVIDIRTRHSRGVELAGVAAIVGGPVSGVQGAGVTAVSTRVDGGAQLAGVVAVSGAVDGAQFAGVVTGNDGLDGVQGSGVVSIASSQVSGAQFAGVINIARGVDGGQFAGVANVNGGRLDGVQLGGVLNVAGDVDGLQGSGVLNVAGDVEGAQVGLVNVAGRVRGVQIGLVNVSRDADFSLGLVSIHTEGRTNVEAWVDSAGYAAAALRHGGTYTHTIVAAGGTPLGGGAAMIGLGYGARPLSNDTLTLDIDGLCFWVVDDVKFRNGGAHLFPQLRVTLGIDLGFFDLIAGGALGVEIAKNGDRATRFFPAVQLEGTREDGVFLQPSLFVGLRI